MKRLLWRLVVVLSCPIAGCDQSGSLRPAPPKKSKAATRRQAG